MNLRQLQELKADVPQYRKNFIRLVSRQDGEIDALLDDLDGEITGTIERNSRADQIQDQDEVSNALPLIFGFFVADLLGIMSDKNQDAAQIQHTYLADDIRKKYVGISGFSDHFIRFNQRADNYVDDIPKRLPFRGFPGSSYTVGGAIKSIEKSSIDVVRSIIAVGIRDGKGAREIASDIALYIKPLPEGKPVSPFSWVRDRLGKMKVARIESGQIRAGSVSYNAFRIARTEINNTFRRATVDLTRNQPWIRGYIWNTSPSHPATDVCDTWRDESPYKYNELPEGHPNCMCYVTADLIDPKEIIL